MADIEKLTVTLEAKVADYNADLARAAKFTQQQTAKMERDFASLLGKFGQRAPQSLDKLASGMASVGKGALTSQVETELLNATLDKTGVAAGDVGHKLGSMSTQGMAAFHSLRGGAEMLAQGVSPLRVLAMEMNNLTYAASGPGGLAGAMKEAFGIFRGLLNPIVGVTAGVVGLGLAAVGLGAKFAASQSKVDLALTGVGKSAGATVGQINEIAESVAKSGELSRSEATDVATAIASTGRASAESTEKATALAHAYSLVFNKDLNKSAMDLAQAIADPGHAIDALNGRLGTWSAEQVELVKNLALSGNRQQAAKIIIDGLTKSIGKASEQTDFWSRNWTKVSNSISNFFSATGKQLNKATGNQTPEDALAEANDRLKALQSGHFNLFGGVSFGSSDEIAAQIAKIKELEAGIDATKKSAKDSRDAIAASEIVTEIDPTIKNLDQLDATIQNIEKHAADLKPEAKAVVDNVLASMKGQSAAIRDNLALAKQRYDITSAQLGLDIKANAIELAAINARSPAQKAEIAYRQALLQLQNTPGVSPAQAEVEAELARTKALADAQHQLSEASRDRIFQAGQSVEQAQLENSVTGQSIDVVTTLTQRFQLLAAARAESNKNGTVVSPEELAAMDEAARKLGQLAAAQAALSLKNDTEFDIAQFGRSQSEQNVYAALQSRGLLTNGEIVTGLAKEEAALLRTREAMAQLADTEKTFASSFLHDLIDGKSAVQALGDALNQVASKLLDLGIDNLVAGLKPANGGLLSLLGFASGGFVSGPGSSTSDSIPAQLSNGEFVVNADATKKNRALLEAINGGKFGKFANGGVVGTSAMRMPNISLPKVSPVPSNAPQIIFNAPLINAPNATSEAVDKMNATSIPALKSLIRGEVAQAMTRSSKIKNIIRKG